MRARTLATVTAAALAIAFGGVVVAQQTPPARPVLHEPIPDLAPEGSPAIGGAHRGGNPTAIAAGDKVLPQPALDQPPSGAVGASGTSGAGGAADHPAPVLGTHDFASDRETSLRPDEHTGADNTLHYVSVFNPDVLPFKRMSAFDQTQDDFTLHVARTALTELGVGGTTDARTRDRFWGDVDVALAPGTDVPLPSVAPDMRILSYEVKPPIRLAFSKDGADNFYIRTDEPSASGTYHVVFYADADAGYFAPQLPPHKYRVRDVAARVPPELAVAVPAAVMREAQTTLGALGVDRDMDLGIAFNKLVGYFRAFKPGEIAHPSGNDYRDLCDQQVGVCRHRAYAFMITANALGVPTRMVENEAHAFVEVWLPERGWQRVDLGGAALNMEVAGANNKTLHRPRGDDPFAKPEEYTKNYTQLEGDIRGLTSQQLADKHRSLDQAPASGDTASTRAGGGNGGNGHGGGSAAGSTLAPEHITPDPSLPAVAPDPKKATPRLIVTQAASSAYRGDLLHVEGLARVDGKPLAGHVVAVYLAPAGQSGAHPIEIGSAVTGGDGMFRVDLPVPAGLTLSTYEIYLSSLEDAHFNASLSD